MKNRKSIIDKSKLKRGSVTVFVTLILVPCVFFTGFIVDLARLKLFSNQAVMAADTYGAAVLSDYDGYLYTLYGLFAISQNGKIDIDATGREIIKTFNDASEGKGAFMPYSNAQNMKLSLEMIEKSAMSNNEVLETQIADYMKYRIIQKFVEMQDGTLGGLIDAIEQMSNLEENLNALKAVEELADACEKFDEAAKAYYKAFELIDSSSGESAFEATIGELNDCITDYNVALKALEEIKEELYDAEDEGQVQEHEDKVSEAQDTLNDAIDALEGAESKTGKKEDVLMAYSGMLFKCQNKGNELITEYNKVQEKIKKAKTEVEKDGVDEDLKQQVEEDVNKIKLIDENAVKTLNKEVESYNTDLKKDINEIKADGVNTIEKFQKDYSSKIETNTTYLILKKYYQNDSTETEKTKKKKNEYSNEAQNKLDDIKNESNDNGAKDIPDKYASASGGGSDNFAIKNLFTNLKGLFGGNNLGNMLIDDYYLVEYDFGMFTCRTTNVNSDTKETTFVGYELDPKVNYSYLAEIEYLIAGKAGDGSASSNLEYVRNRILAFRMMMNFLSTYKCKPINSTINTIANAAAVAPAVSVLINFAMRIGVAAYETGRDWNDLKEGNGVVLFKTEVGDFDVASLEKFGINVGGGKNDKAKLDYKQYCEILLFFFTDRNQRAERTANLIEINVNNVAGGDKFSMDKAYTAVDATFKCRLPFAVMPKGFAKQVSPGNYNAIEKFEKNYYVYTVTRGY